MSTPFQVLSTVLWVLKQLLTANDAEALRAVLLDIARTHQAKLGFRDEYGQRYTIDFQLDWNGRQAQVRSGWMIEHGSTTPRLISCYVL